ncbi:three-helix bundle dimerization domain-containing protein [Nocardia amamiensis]|uniref:three-helix bundle dimerization domain-containing protein n=1 Tax=Nocardia amamiensis TaxID=404578 RepID=UPI0035A21B75
MQIGELVARLAKRHPEHSATTVALIVRQAHRRFTNTATGEIVPLLVERSAGQELSGTSIGHEPAVSDHRDMEQAQVLFNLLVVEADEIAFLIEAMQRGVGSGPAISTTAESRRLQDELHEVHRCLAQIRRRFPQVSNPCPPSRPEAGPRARPRKEPSPQSTNGCAK